MMTRFLIACAAFVAIGAQAAPIVFTTTQYDTVALGLAGAISDVDADVSPPAALPVLSTATAVASDAFAFAFGLGSTGLLSVTAEADSFGQPAQAAGQSHFLGLFNSAGPLSLHLGFDFLTSIVGGGTAAGGLSVVLTNTVGGTTTTLLNELYVAGRVVDLLFDLPIGGTGALDLVLFSEVSSFAAGQSAQNFLQVVFSATLSERPVPLPATLLLMMAGFLMTLRPRTRAPGEACRQSRGTR